MGVSKNRGIPKWMVKPMETPIKMDDLGVPLFLETPICRVVPLPSNTGKYRFSSGSPLKCKNPGDDYYREGGQPNVSGKK